MELRVLAVGDVVGDGGLQCVKIRADLPAVEGVVAEGDDVRPGVQHPVRLPGRQAGPAGVFAVDHAEVRAVEFFQAPQMLFQTLQPAVADHVADGQNTKLHGKPPFTIFFSIAFSKNFGNAILDRKPPAAFLRLI